MAAGDARPGSFSRRRGLQLTLSVLLSLMVAACGAVPAPASEALPAHLRLAPCGGASRFRWAEGSAWVALEARIGVEAGLTVAAEGDERARVCAADGTVMELASGTTIEIRPAEDKSRLEISLSQGRLLLMALEPAYQFEVAGGLVQVSQAPTRIWGASDAGTTQLRVEQGQMASRVGTQTLALERCWEILTAPGVDPEIRNYCAAGPDPAPVPTIRPPVDLTPTPHPTATSSPTPSPTSTPDVTETVSPAPTATPSATPTATPTSTPTATPTVFIPPATPTPTNTPTPLPTDTPAPPPPPPPTDPPPPPPPPTDTPEPEPEPTPEPSPIP